jgi:hypothetical protein
MLCHKKITQSSVTLFLLLCFIGPYANSPLNIIKNGKVKARLRYRYEHAKQSKILSSNANTLQTRLHLISGEYKGFSAVTEGNFVTIVGQQRFNSGGGTSPSRARYAIIADPSSIQLNQLFLKWKNKQKASIKIGRQIISLDNQRFIGPVGFRQTPQSFLAISIKSQLSKDISTFYAYIANVYRIWGPQAVTPFRSNENYTNLFNARYTKFKLMHITPYIYLIKNKDVPSFSTNTIGIQVSGKPFYQPFQYHYLIESAYQTNAFNNPTTYSAHYLNIAGGIGYSAMKGELGLSLLSGNNNEPKKAFITPLATLHLFQGWNDMFLSTPNAGIIDAHFSANYLAKTLNNTILQASFHVFNAEANSTHYGNEADISAKLNFKKYFSFGAALGYFKTYSTLPNTKKIWLTLTASI